MREKAEQALRDKQMREARQERRLSEKEHRIAEVKAAKSSKAAAKKKQQQQQQQREVSSSQTAVFGGHGSRNTAVELMDASEHTQALLDDNNGAGLLDEPAESVYNITDA